MLIIIEGVDRTGKSTLAAALAEATGGEIIHSSKPSGHPLEEYETRLDDYRPGEGRHLILDRWHLGERVWPQIFGRVSDYDLPMFKHTEMFLRSRGAVMVYAARTDFTDWANELAEFGEPIDGVTGAQARDLFDDALAERYWNERRYNFKVDDIDEFVGRIVKQAIHEESRAAGLAAITTEYVGTLDPRILLIGERQNDGPGRIENTPTVPFVPYRTTSGHFMLSELKTWKDLGICNATKDDGTPEELRELWFALGRPTVVALGNTAHAAATGQLCEFMDVPKIPHPQYVRRFKRAEGPGYYARLLNEAVGR